VTSVSTGQLSALVKSRISELARGYEEYCILDFPAHYNTGDSAIWVGEIEALGALHKRAPKYVSHNRYPISEIGRFVTTDDIIYIHGGGNFGDLWPRFQAYREAVIQAYPKHRIVQLPQTVHYRTPANADSARRAIAGHPDFHLIVRDRESETFAHDMFDCPVILAPDSAFCIDPDGFRKGPSRGLVTIFREDQERRADAVAGRAFFEGVEITDWAREPAIRQKTKRVAMGLLGLASVDMTMSARVAYFNAMARNLVGLGLMQISSGRVVVTDRLHGHILCSLLEKPHVVIDNTYGKIARFVAAWGCDDKTVVVQDYAAAHREARKLLQADEAAGQGGIAI
jgi:pyruvyl transferase EpsO